MAKIRIAVVGLGGMGQRWAKIANTCPESCLKLIIDTDKEKAPRVEKYWNCDFASDLKTLSSPDIDAVVVATPNVFLAPITKLALQSGKHVLCEKPAGINSNEIKENINLISENPDLVYMVGFNHRFHPALAKAKQLVAEDFVGKIRFIRGVYGHGGRIGYENEWRSKLELAGGGELLDQGVHLIDLALWFLEDSFNKIFGVLTKNFWSQTLEDNAFLLLQNNSEATISLHASWTQWQKKFLWEIYGENGYVTVEGLGGNYGLETLRFCKKKSTNGKMERENEIVFYPEKGYEDPDISIFSLWRQFTSSIMSKTLKSPNCYDALRTLEIVEKVYKQGGINEKSGLS